MASTTNEPRAQQEVGVVPTQVPWVSLGICASLVLLAYLPVLIRLAHQWNTDEDMGHGFFVPAIAAYIAWQRRQELVAMPMKPSYLGLVLLVWAAVQLYIGALGAELFFQRTAFVITVVGSILLVCGWTVLRALSLPLFLLLFMVPIPSIIYSQITFPLQLFASRVAEVSLNAIGIPVLREGNVLELPTQRLSVVEACSGIRSLLSLSFLSLVYAYFFDRRPWMRIALLAATVPIAIIANAARVTITGIISNENPELAKGFFHSAEGWVIFMVAFVFLVATHFVIGRIANRFSPRPESTPPAETSVG